MRALALLFAAGVCPSEAATGVDVSQAVSSSEWSCLRQPGGQGAVSFGIARVYESGGKIDPNGRNTILAAKKAGVAHVDGYVFPCVSCGSPASQVKSAHDAVSGSGYGMLWYDVENYHWSTSLSANQAFIKSMIDEGIALGVNAGIYTNYDNWQSIVGLDWSYPASKGLPLWYAHYDNTPSFSDFKPFGGWSKPNIKQYMGDASSCGAGVDYNWYPDSSFRNTTTV